MKQEELNENQSNNMLVYLEGIGFYQKQDKEGCFVKELIKNNTKFFLYWDLRKEKPFFYVYKEDEDKALPKRDHVMFEEYVLFAQKFNIKESKQPCKVEQKPVSNSQSAMVVLDRKDEAYTLINQKDDQQLLAELQGAFLDEFVYSFPTMEGKVTGLSWAGVKEVVRKMGNINVEELIITETPDTYRVLAKAKDMQRNITMWGVAEQTKKMKLISGEEIFDIHAISKVVSRAQRNSCRALIPELFIKTMISAFLGDKNEKRN